MSPQLLSTTIAFLLLAWTSRPLSPQYPTAQVPDTRDGISVFGTGDVAAKPNLIEIDLPNSGVAELSGDAIVKYRDNKRRMLEAFEALKLKNLQIVEKGVSLTGGGNAAEMEMQFRRGMTTAATDKPQIQVSRNIRLKLSDVQDVPEEELMETLGKIFDVAKDSGIPLVPSADVQAIARQWGRNISGASPVFVLDKIAEMREQAYRKAVEDARARAQRLAALTGVKIGAVQSVQEVSVSGDDPSVPMQPYYYYGYPMMQSTGEAEGPRVTAAMFVEIPVRVKLFVRFGISKPEPEAAEK